MTRLKICGVTRLEDAELAVEAGAWAVGLIFFPGSERRCRFGEASVIAAALKRRAEVAGVFVNAELEKVTATADAMALSLIQLHGDEGPSYCAEVARRTGCRVIKAVRVHSGADAQAVRTFHVDFHLLDTGHATRYGGTGETWDWRLAAELGADVPVIVSGGLTPENVAEAIAQTQPWAVDVASGVEASPGIKDPEKVRAFAAAVAPARAAA